jgi:hypothetical protein
VFCCSLCVTFHKSSSRSCNQPASPAGGGLGTCVGTTPAGGACDFTCNVGYTLQPSGDAGLNGISNYCHPSIGNWGPLQTCKTTGFPCSLSVSELPKNATSVGTCGAVASGSSCSISCANGFYPVPSQRLCSSGSLSTRAQICRGNPCPAMTGSAFRDRVCCGVAARLSLILECCMSVTL